MEINVDSPSGPLQIAVALIVGFGTIGYGAYSYATQSASLDSATTVDATIVSTSVATTEGRRGTTDYRPQATFNYTFEGERYTSSNVYPGQLPREFETKADARAQLAGYESGDSATVHVPPDNPQNAYLRHKSSNKPFLVMGFGLTSSHP